MTSAPELLYTAEQTRLLDRCAIKDHGIAGIALMHRAARAVYAQLLQRWPEAEAITVFCGTGNNGGDGYLVADLAHKANIPTLIVQVGDVSRMSADAKAARDQALAHGVPERAFESAVAIPAGVIVDAMLGTGLGGDVRSNYAAAIAQINGADQAVLAVDLPSGLCADTGRVLGAVVKAQCTVSFIGCNRGLFTADGPDCCGEIVFDALDVPPQVYEQCADTVSLPQLPNLLRELAPRPATAHKGSYGRVLVIAGDHGMGGAGLMASEAALRSGAGLVNLATRAEHLAAALARTPELMVSELRQRHDLDTLIADASVIVIGPGLGQGPWGQQMLQRVLESELPLLLDADALNLLAQWQLGPRHNWILTPHPGEAARLLGMTTQQLQADRFAAVTQLQAKYGGVVLLKGSGTLVASDQGLALCRYGNPGMASGGMGDVLSGVIAGLWAQGLAAHKAAILGACVHGAAADEAAKQGMRGLLATDLLPRVRALLQ